MLTVCGEWLRLNPLQRAIAAVRPNYVPPALTSAGLFSAFASIYAAYALYDLMLPITAFICLAAVALVAVGLSLMHGWFVALLGLLGGFVTPALIVTPEPSPWGLFGYLLIIQVACLLVARWTAWWWLAFAALIGAALWPSVWLQTQWGPQSALPVGAYLIMTFVAFILMRPLDRAGKTANLLKPIAGPRIRDAVARAAALVVAVLIFQMVRTTEYETAAVLVLAVFALLCLVVGRREAVFDDFSVLAAILVLLAMASWPLPESFIIADTRHQFEVQHYLWYPTEPMIPPELKRFARAALLFGTLFGIGGYVVLWGARRPALWAGVSAAVPVILLVVAYWKISDWNVDMRWAALAAALAFASLLGAARVARNCSEKDLSVALGFYAAALVAFVSLGVAMTLREAWLTVALSLQLPALAWISKRVPERPIRLLAAIVGGIVLVRLLLNHNVLDYPPGDNLLLNWIVYGYGVPAIMFFVSSRIFGQSAKDHLATLLEAGALVFFVFLVSLEIRIMTTGSLDSPNYGLFEQSLQSLAWLSISFVLALNYQKRADVVSLVGYLVLFYLAAGQIILLQLLHDNPVVTQELIGSEPVLNALFLAYAAPAIILFGIAAISRSQEPKLVAEHARILGLVLIFAYVSLELRRAFQGPVLSLTSQSDAEFYAYSLAWLIYAAALLALGIAWKSSFLRHASLVVLLVTVVKVFGFDMNELKGLYRVASFLGLGLSLVGIGYIYQKYVFKQPAIAEAETTT